MQDHWTQLLDGLTHDARRTAQTTWPRSKCTSIRRIRDGDPSLVRVGELLAITFSDVSSSELEMLHAMARHKSSGTTFLSKLLMVDLEGIRDRLARFYDLGLVSCDRRGLWDLRPIAR